jgi:hypothetical protein
MLIDYTAGCLSVRPVCRICSFCSTSSTAGAARGVFPRDLAILHLWRRCEMLANVAVSRGLCCSGYASLFSTISRSGKFTTRFLSL